MSHVRNAASVALSVILALSCSMVRAAEVSMEAGMDKLGSDYRGFATGRDPQACRQACADDAACQAYTFVKPGIKGPEAMCFLKSAAPPSVANDCCVSGAKQAASAARTPVRLPALAGRPAPAPATPSLEALLKQSPQRVQITPALRLSDIRALPDSTTVRLASGREMSAGRYKQLVDAFSAIRTAGLDRKPDPKLALSRTQGPAQVQLRPGADLQAIARLPEAHVVQLPTGEKFTVGDLKRLSALQKVTTGRSLLEPQPAARRPSLQGPAVRATADMSLLKLADKPDSTIIEAPNGTRVTLGELRAYHKKTQANGARR